MWDDYFMNQIEAGMPGYMTVISNGELSICPHNDTSDAVREMVQALLDANAPDIAGLKAKAAQSGNGTAFRDVQNIGTDHFSQGSFVLRFACYADTDDIMFSIVIYDEEQHITRAILTFSDKSVLSEKRL